MSLIDTIALPLFAALSGLGILAICIVGSARLFTRIQADLAARKASQDVLAENEELRLLVSDVYVAINSDPALEACMDQDIQDRLFSVHNPNPRLRRLSR